MPTVVEVAEAVKTALNAGAFSMPFTAERRYLPRFELEEMEELHVTVVPKGVELVQASRGRSQTDVKVDVAVQKKLEAADAAELDPLMALVEEIAEHFKARRLPGMPQAVWLKTENVPVYSQEHMQELRQFTSVVTFTFRAAT